MATTRKHFDISQLPSLKAGMSAEEEATKRRKTCRFIEEAGRLLKLPRVAVATAMVFFHRFYAKHSFFEHDRFEVAVASSTIINIIRVINLLFIFYHPSFFVDGYSKSI